MTECDFIMESGDGCGLPADHGGMHRRYAARASAPSVEPGPGERFDRTWSHYADDCPVPPASPEPTPGLRRRFYTPNDFMHYTHDVLDMHRGLMIPGCIYCNGDM